MERGLLRAVAAERDSTSGLLRVGGKPFAELYPASTPPYALGKAWWQRHELIVFNGRRYPPYGAPIVIRPEYLERIGEFDGIPLFAEKDPYPPAGPVYVPVAPGCVFQPYMWAT